MAAQAISLGLGGLGQILQGFGVGNNPQEWIQDAMMALYNRAQQGDEMGRGIFERFSNPVRDNGLDTSEALKRQVIDLAPYLMQYGQEGLSGVNPAILDYLSRAGDITGAGGINQGLSDLLGGFGQTGDTARAGFQGGGWTPQGQEIFDTLSPLMAGRANNAQLSMGDVGPNLIGQRGQTALTQGLADRGMEAANSRGMNPVLEAAQQNALATLGNQGYNDVSGGLADRGLGMMDSAFSRALGAELMSPEEAANWAREDAVTQGEQQRERVYDEISQRGGGPATLSSGLQNQKKIDFADKIAQNSSAAARQAFLAQQELGLRDRANAASLVGTGGQLAGQGESLAAGRTGQAFNAIPGTTNAATGVLAALLSGSLGAGNLENARMNTGVNMNQALLNSMLQAAGQSGSTLANQNQYALGLGNLGNASSAGQANLFGQMFNNNLGTGQLGNTLAGTSINGSQGATQNLNNIWNNMGSQMTNALSPLAQLAGQGLGYAGQNVGAMSSAIGGQKYEGNATPWGGIGDTLGGLLGGLVGGRKK